MKKLLAVSATALVATLAVAAPAFAAVNNPPVLPHSIISFPQRDFISADGYNPGQKATVNVIRNGVTIGTSGEMSADADGLVEVNHPGGGCWVGHTPDILPGDVVQVLTAPDTGDATATSNVKITQTAAETSPGSGTVVMKGTATMADGTTPIPIDQIEARLVANKQAFVASGLKRTLRAPGEGTIAYDAPGSTSWTATFTGLNGVNPADNIRDADRAVSSENRILWLGANPASGQELTIYEVGDAIAPGPSAPCTAPLAQTAMTDVSRQTINSANIANGDTLTVSGVAQDGITGVNVALGGKTYTAVPAGGTWSVTVPTADLDALPQGNSNIVATFEGAVAPPAETRTISKDTVAPAAATATPGTGVYKNTQFVSLQKDEADATIRYTIGAIPADPTTTTGQLYNGSQIAVSSSQKIKALVVDKAGNPSSTVSTFDYTIDGVAPSLSATPGSGVVSKDNISVTLSATDLTATEIFYTKDGPDPDQSSTKYNGESILFDTEGTHTVKALAVDAAGNQTSKTFTYTVDRTAPSVNSNLGTGSYNGTQSFTLNSEAGAKIYFTKGANPADPTQSSTLYTGTAIPVSSTQTIKAIAVDGAGNVSPVISRTITIRTASGVSLSVAGTNLKLGNSRTISGMVTPAQPAGSKVKLTIVKPGTDVVKTLSLVNSRYSFTYKPPVTGTYKVQVSFAQDVDNLAGKSVIKSFKVVS